ncbi:molybdopterin molybdotransferase MoeA [Pseudoalteromonas sp. T1lg48]|uniref:molybdopterin molybdotransferase MoeA n=1 Tax=Pseudoalteromonas sp. T1lg48 TaxID=2077100 RepID=UPI000CF68356|nr:gephyrin-like molybdotransferase Glp [Pseudoalteromonas sp. T1lg48]
MHCDCDSLPAKLKPFEQALAELLASAQPIQKTEHVPLKDLPGKVLAEPIYSSHDIPPYDNSAMDGYAVCLDEQQPGTNYEVVGTSLAGHPAKVSLLPGQAVRIMTGAQIPAGTSAVIMQEKVERIGDHIQCCTPPPIDANIRKQGEDISSGQQLLPAGHLVSTRDIALLSAVGIGTALVFQTLTVALISTGDELVEPGASLGQGQIYDSNRHLLHAMLVNLGVQVIDMGIIADNPQTIRECFLCASESADVIITSGGVSVGDADYVKQILSELGSIDFWKIAIKPGKPFAFGKLGDAAFIGLPGNPVSAAVTFDQLAIPFLKAMAHQPPGVNTKLSAVARVDFGKKPGRTEFQRGFTTQDAQGQWYVESAGKQGSGILSALSRANCHVLLTEQSSGVKAGEQVEIIPYQYL